MLDNEVILHIPEAVKRSEGLELLRAVSIADVSLQLWHRIWTLALAYGVPAAACRRLLRPVVLVWLAGIGKSEGFIIEPPFSE